MRESTTIIGRQHIGVLDGLRGIAILLVLAVHFYPRVFLWEAYPTLAPFLGRVVVFGKYGVELFFVLSGFLITGILIDTKREPGFLKKFYARRILRIFPLYYASLLAVLVVLPLFVPLDAGAESIVNRQARLWLYLANLPGGWVWDDSQLFMLGHFWSLCVEEHFYLVWPLLVAWLPSKRIFQLCCALVVAATACRAIAALGGLATPALFHWLTLQKMDGLAIGALIAIAVREREFLLYLPSGATFRRLSLGLFLVLAALLILPRRFNVPAVDALTDTVAVAFFGLVLVGVLQSLPTGRPTRILSNPFLAAFGKYSYGLYVIHGILRPCFAHQLDFGDYFRRHGFSAFYCILYYLVTIGVSFGLAYASYHVFEKHFLALKRYFDYAPNNAIPLPRVVTPSVVAAASVESIQPTGKL
jgi:peptidoglycan/LPS O-acetylase OafA/YrhL